MRIAQSNPGERSVRPAAFIYERLRHATASRKTIATLRQDSPCQSEEFLVAVAWIIPRYAQRSRLQSDQKERRFRPARFSQAGQTEEEGTHGL